MATVLVVDDEFGIGEILEAILADEGHDVILAVNGRQALDRLDESRIDLVVSDLMMPIMDGVRLFTAVRERRDLDHVGFVLMSSLPESAVADRISGYEGYLHKPFRIPAVLEMVKRVLDGGGRR
jgi:DNA-binding response OmpR family regulator